MNSNFRGNYEEIIKTEKAGNNQIEAVLKERYINNTLI
jgi:hypothetical protein